MTHEGEISNHVRRQLWEYCVGRKLPLAVDASDIQLLAAHVVRLIGDQGEYEVKHLTYEGKLGEVVNQVRKGVDGMEKTRTRVNELFGEGSLAETRRLLSTFAKDSDAMFAELVIARAKDHLQQRKIARLALELLKHCPDDKIIQLLNQDEDLNAPCYNPQSA
jgi:hypothetical protein